MASRRVVLGDLPLAEKERFYEFLVANKVEFVADQSGETFVATIRVVPPEPSTARITGRTRQASKSSMRRPSSQGARSKGRVQGAGGVGPAPSQDAAATLKAAQSVLRRRYTRFCNLLPSLAQPPKAVRKTALVRFAEEVYDARYEKDAAFIKSEAAGETLGTRLPQTFPDFVYEFAAKRYGLKALVSNSCWGMVSSVELLRGPNPGIELFGKFLEESYDATDLLFFLFTRSAIDRVLLQDSKKEDDPEKAGDDAPKAKVKGYSSKNPKSTLLPQDIKLDAKQCVRVIKMAIDSKRQELRDQVLKRIDAAMVARTEHSSKKAPTLEPERLLAVATEEYHNSRGEIADAVEGDTSREGALAIGGDGSSPGILPTERELPPEVRKEVRQVTQRLIASLSAQGETDVNTQQVYEWALQVTLRRHKLGDFLEQDHTGGATSLDLAEMQEAAMNLVEQPGEGGVPPPFVVSNEVMNFSPEEFERNLEANVRQLLLNATSEMVSEAASPLPGKAFKDEQAALALRSALVSEIAPTADILMESIISKDFRRWLDTLRIDGHGTQKHRQQFEKLHDEFQQGLNSEITATVVQKICRAVVAADELHDMVRSRAIELAKHGRSKKLGESSSDEENFGGTAAFGGEDAF